MHGRSESCFKEMVVSIRRGKGVRQGGRLLECSDGKYQMGSAGPAGGSSWDNGTG